MVIKMSSPTEQQLAKLEASHLNLCREVNMDRETEGISWDSFKEIYLSRTLPGELKHWLCCALYAACRESFTPTVGSAQSVVRGNCVSLTKLLRSCSISIHEFFQKIEQWMWMTNASLEFRNQVKRLEKSFGVSAALYKKYAEIFDKLFISPPIEKKNKKSRPVKCITSKLYEFCWCLFLCAKGEEPKHTGDLVTSFHLLLCCIDLIFANAVAENRKDIINPSFSGLPPNWHSNSFDPQSVTPLCIMKALCNMYDVAFVSAMSIKNYSWKPIITNFLNQKTLRGKVDNFMEIISNTNFEPNLKSLNNAYEQYVLSVGEFDERIFFSNASLRKSNMNQGDMDNERVNQSQMCESIPSIAPATPLTGRHHLPSKDVLEPVANATQNVKQLYIIAEKEMPLEVIRRAGDDVIQKLEERLKSMGQTFSEKYRTEADERFKLARALYYDLLQKIVTVELRTKPNLDLKTLLETEIFNTTLIACCVEIVIVSYNSQINFPWILECFDLHAFHFYKIIEIVVLRHDNALTRSIIKHLNTIEEKCLDSLVWRSSSPLWDAIKQWDGSLPSWIHVDKRNTNCIATGPPPSQNGSTLKRSILQSPENSAYDTFNQSTVGDSARRNLFFSGDSASKVNDSAQNNQKNERRVIKAGSLTLFFRKFYKLAFIRMDELCTQLSMKTDEYLNQIWTLFEYSIVKKTELMKDRHLDQILMCAIYVFIKVKEIAHRTFTDIMKYYRLQPQAESNIYRNVLRKPASTTADNKPVYGDIIQFYNEVYVVEMSPYALNFGEKSRPQKDLLLSPHPPEKVMSPKKISNNHQLYIKTLDKKELPLSPKSITYEFCKSPAKDLRHINDIVSRKKRNSMLNEDDDDNSEKKKKISESTQGAFITKKIHVIIKERQEK